GRARPRRHSHGQAMVAVLLLHFGRQPRVREQEPRGHEARPSSHPQGERDLCGRPGAGGTSARGPRLRAGPGHRAPVDAGAALRALAGLRHGGDGAFLRPASARGGHDLLDAPEDHRRQYRLAVRQRVEARAEGTSPRMNFGRREFVSGLTVVTASGVLGLRPEPAQADPPPETTNLRLLRTPSICEAPAQVASALLEGEGFTDVQYIKVANSVGGDKAIASGEVDLGLTTALAGVMRIDAGDPRVLLSGVHVGCFELFGTGRVHSIRDLKGKTVAVPALGSSQHAYIASMAAYVGVDPRKDINWVVYLGAQAIQVLAEGK